MIRQYVVEQVFHNARGTHLVLRQSETSDAVKTGDTVTLDDDAVQVNGLVEVTHEGGTTLDQRLEAGAEKDGDIVRSGTLTND
jgi:hypothetical protein